MNILGLLLAGLAGASTGLAAPAVEGTFLGDRCLVEGILPENLAIRVLVELGPARRPTDAELRAMGREHSRDLVDPESPIRPVKVFQVTIGGTELALAPSAYADLHDAVRVRVWKQRQGVNCMIQGKDGPVGYHATYTFVPTRKGWAQASRHFKRQGGVETETRQMEVQAAIEAQAGQ